MMMMESEIANQSEPHSSEVSSQETVASTDPEWFDDLTGDKPSAMISAETGSVDTMLSKNDFHAVFCVGFSTASHMTGLQSLKVEKEDAAAVECTAAVYDTINEIPALRFMLMPQGKWLGRIIAVAAFAVPMASAVSTEMVAGQEVPEAALDDSEPMMTLRERAAA